MTVTGQLAEAAVAIRYDDLAPEVTDVARRLLLDALACTLGGFASPTGAIVRKHASAPALLPEATFIGTSLRVSRPAAIVANQAMLRYLDYNDAMMIPIDGGQTAALHPSGSIPVA